MKKAANAAHSDGNSTFYQPNSGRKHDDDYSKTQLNFEGKSEGKQLKKGEPGFALAAPSVISGKTSLTKQNDRRKQFDDTIKNIDDVFL